MNEEEQLNEDLMKQSSRWTEQKSLREIYFSHLNSI
jgi:hypothetical protein